MCGFDPLIKAIDNYLMKADNDLSDTLKNEGYEQAEDTVKKINSIEDSLADILEKERNYFIQQLESKSLEEILNEYLPGIIAGDYSDEAIAELFKQEFENIMQKLADAYIKGIDKELSFSTFTDRTTDWIKSWSKELGEKMKLSSHTEIENILSEALENGNSIQTVTDNLMESYSFSRKRARATAITEILTAHSASAQEAYRQSPAVEKKEWKHTGAHKNKPRQNHVDMDGKAVDKNKSFELVGADGKTYYPYYPRDPILPASERVNCHCISQPIVSSSILGLSLAERRALQQQAIDEDNGAWEKELDATNKAKAGIV